MPRPAPSNYPLISSHCSGPSRSKRRRRSSTSTIRTPTPPSSAPIEILNPGQAYETTQSLADRIRAFTHPHHPRAERDRRLPSARRLRAVIQPSQYALFVMGGWTLKGRVVWRADLTLEFLDQAGKPVSRATREVAWTRPRFQLHGLMTPIPAFPRAPDLNPTDRVAGIRSKSGPCRPLPCRPGTANGDGRQAGRCNVGSELRPGFCSLESASYGDIKTMSPFFDCQAIPRFETPMGSNGNSTVPAWTERVLLAILWV